MPASHNTKPSRPEGRLYVILPYVLEGDNGLQLWDTIQSTYCNITMYTSDAFFIIWPIKKTISDPHHSESSL